MMTCQLSNSVCLVYRTPEVSGGEYNVCIDNHPGHGKQLFLPFS